jgi:hypothetical protein
MMRGAFLLPSPPLCISLAFGPPTHAPVSDWVRFGMFDVRKEIGYHGEAPFRPNAEGRRWVGKGWKQGGALFRTMRLRENESCTSSSRS